jgi:hypothetical protein
VRSPVIRSNGVHAGTADGIVAGGRAPRWSVLRRFGWSYRDVVGCIVGAVATGAILINGLFLQSGPHPAPIFNSGPIHVAAIVTKDATVGGCHGPANGASTEPACLEPVKVELPAPSFPLELSRTSITNSARRF